MRWPERFWPPRSQAAVDRPAKRAGRHSATTRAVISAGCSAFVVLCSSAAFADVCSVPSVAHPTIQNAADDGSCTEIVLAAQVFVETVAISRSLLLRGDSSTATVIEGRVTVTGGTTEVTLQNLQVDGGGCVTVALDVGGGAQVTSQQDVVVLNAPGGECPIFLDGFELGNTSVWSATVP